MEQSNQNTNMDEEYEQDQIQQILLQESEKQKLQMERELKESQDKEYQQSLETDIQNIQTKSTENDYDTISTEEMRRIRLIRFDGYKLIKG